MKIQFLTRHLPSVCFFAAAATVTTILSPIVTAGAAAPTQAPQAPQAVEYVGGRPMELPRWNIKTNLLYDLTGTINLGAEFRAADAWSIELPFNYNPFSYSNDRKWKHFMFQPELRRWFGTGRDAGAGPKVFSGHFAGVHATYAYYNISNLPKPFAQYMRTHRFQGMAYGVGLSYGYRWNFNHRWGLEATVGVGYLYKDYDVFECGHCGKRIASETKHYFGPTKAGLNLIFGIGGKPAVPPVAVPPPAPVAKPAPYEPNLSTSFVVPDVEAVKARSATYTAYLEFRQGRSEIVENLSNNAAELRRIEEITRSVVQDGSSTLSRIVIDGYASPEDTARRNLALSERRTESLGSYVRARYDVDAAMFDVTGMGEDWATLDSLVGKSNLPERGAVREIIRRVSDLDAREAEIRRLGGGETYRRIFADFYPRLRRTDYRVDYTVAGFTVEEGKRVLATNPRNLSLNELYMIAGTYEPGSRSFNEVFETAVQLFPESDVANVNAAAAALERRDLAAAARYLANVREHTPAYWNNLGVLQWLQGNKGAAADSFSRAGIQSMGNASEVERHFRSIE